LLIVHYLAGESHLYRVSILGCESIVGNTETIKEPPLRKPERFG
jgi:hypothetical protein